MANWTICGEETSIWKKNVDVRIDRALDPSLELSRSRLVIQGKLEELISSNYQPSSISNYEPYRFLREMKEQEELNGKALSYLQQRLVYPYRLVLWPRSIDTHLTFALS